MFPDNIKEMIIDKFIIRKTPNENIGYINKLILRVSRGHALWESENYNFVLPYRCLLCIDVFLLLTLALKLLIYPEEVYWFKSTLDITLMAAVSVFCRNHLNYGKEEEELSTAVDKWWTYVYLEKETAEIKKNVERRLNFVTALLLIIINGAGIGYTVLPFFKYFYNGANHVEDLMVIDSLHDLPWIYLEVVTGSLTVPIGCSQAGHFIANLTAISYTHIAQLQLAGLAFSTIEDRVTRMMGDSKYKRSQVEETFEYLVNNEIRSCAKHYQAIYRQTKQMYKINNSLVNYTFYMGCCCNTTVGVLIAKEVKSSFVILQVMSIMVYVCIVVALMGTFFLISYPMDSIIEEVEALRVQVYGSSWYNLPSNCQKRINLMQSTLTHGPKFKAVLGTEVTNEFLGKILYASYSYMTAILSMDIK